MKQFFPSNPPGFLEHPVSSYEIDPIKETLIRSGFEQIVISVKPREYDILDVSAFARGLVLVRSSRKSESAAKSSPRG
jgi:hypothetical protein